MSYNLAPICLFVYNRPDHTRETLEALSKNELASESQLIIYSDGPKRDDNVDYSKVEKVRKLINAESRFKKINIIERRVNFGLAKSIEIGVTEVTDSYGKIIVLEDDIKTSSGFLKYMNDALELYKDEVRVYHVAAYIFPTWIPLSNTFFYDATSCWGWGTWSRAWCNYISDTEELITRLTKHKKFKRFDRKRGYMGQLERNKSGIIRTWAIKWHTSVFLLNGLCLHPKKSLIENIGFDDLATNTKKLVHTLPKKLIDTVDVKKIQIKESKRAYLALRVYFFQAKIINQLRRLIGSLFFFTRNA